MGRSQLLLPTISNINRRFLFRMSASTFIVIEEIISSASFSSTILFFKTFSLLTGIVIFWLGKVLTDNPLRNSSLAPFFSLATYSSQTSMLVVSARGLYHIASRVPVTYLS